jgi:ABC-type multidrug transport system ATPase subunit
LRLLDHSERPIVVLTASGLTKLYGGTLALVGVEFKSRSGELMLVRGANASGKSTLLRLLAGLATPSAGRVSLTCEADARPGLAFVGHAGQIYSDLTALENLTLAARLAGADTSTLLSMLDRLGVATVAHIRCRALSSGTLRRVALARALATDPDVLFADEPFAGLDSEAADRVAMVLANARDEGRLVIIASHEEVRSIALADRSMELLGGRVINAEPPAASGAR